MRRLLKWASRLYPKDWRNRYGDEFDALLDDAKPQWRDVWDVAIAGVSERGASMKAWYWITGCAALGFTVHLMLLFALNPSGYRSTGQLYVKGASPDAEQSAGQLLASVLRRQNALDLIHKWKLYPDLIAAGKGEQAADDLLAKHISVVGAKPYGPKGELPPGIAMNLRVDLPDPTVAKGVANDVMGLVIDEARKPGGLIPALEVSQVPLVPNRPIRWLDAEHVLMHGAIGGAGTGAIALALVWGWRRLQRRT
jgi:hypothetical protein